ncbi:Ribosomal protein S18 acetylase RimI [Tistlia consotensis]|uniref:Ribosomal protein S18 acetylase RimI n=1 Tax=Tistlia consotensis USBA 355 TaxID=560819 RepID=A0A1Y6BGG0_9PROT|nr:GNAT family N-acetyltransferase [Tistlia consotensis]SMF09926.1 Ribosomal protein S18 acetylase RimI [Tistlia consotensis USBA 355]SNR34149.1 Ribosomal protein S18 acetylase RimI [Tistlia consotensis]
MSQTLEPALQPDAVVFREAEAADLPAIVALLADDALGAARERAEDPLPACYREAFERMRALGGHKLIVAVDPAGGPGGTVVGCLQLMLLPGLARQGLTRAQIEAVRIAAPLRGRGLGGRLILDAVERARAAGCGLVQLTSDRSRGDAHRFYERLGFTASHVGFKMMLD